MQRVAVAGGNRSMTDPCGQRSCRLSVGAREPQVLAACGQLAGDDRPDPSSADDRGGHDRNLLGVTVLTTGFPVQYSPLITKKEPRITPASLDFWRANLKPAAASSSGTSMPSDSLNPTARLPWSSMVYITLMDKPDS